MTFFQVISENPSSDIQFRPELQHQVDQMEPPADNRQHTQINSKTRQTKLTLHKIQAQSMPIDDGTTEAIVNGDLITIRIDGTQGGSLVLARGFGGHGSSGLLERTANSRIE